MMAWLAAWAGTLRMVFFAAVIGAVYYGGYEQGRAKYDKVIAAEAKARDAADADLAVAKAQLGGAMAALKATEGRVNDVIRAKSDGRSCLHPDVVRLLNDLWETGAGNRPGETAPAGSGPRPAAADPGHWTTDADIADWAKQAELKYGGCRLQLKAVRQAAGEIDANN